MTHPPRPAPPHASDLTGRLAFFLCAALLLLAPLVRGGNRQAALVVLLALGLALLAVLLTRLSGRWVAARSGAGNSESAQPAWWWLAVGLVAASPAWLALLQLLPLLGPDTWAALPGRAPYLPALASAGGQVPARLPLSLNPSATWAALGAGLPVSAAFLAALLASQRQVGRLLQVLLVAGAVQAVLSLLQLAQGPGSLFFFDSGPISGRFIGSFKNRNHLADFFAMLVPVWFAVLVLHNKQATDFAGRRWLPRRVFRALWLFAGFTLVVLLLGTQSRGGLIAGAVALALCTAVLLTHLRRKPSLRVRLAVGAAAGAFTLAALMAAGLEGMSQRFGSGQVQVDASVRATYAWSTLAAARELWPWGSGMGSFESVFPRFQALGSLGLVDHAHNDYPQLLMELGAAALVIALALLALVGWQLRQLGRALRQQRRLSTEQAVRCFAGLGVLALLVHSTVDFNMHIPALAITAGVLMGVFLRPASPPREIDEGHPPPLTRNA